MKCTKCRNPMKVSTETRRAYAGLEGVEVEGVQVAHCEKCGNQIVSYRNIEQLNRNLAMKLATKHAALMPNEVRFLRTYLGLSGTDLAKRMGVNNATVSRWERLDKPAAMGPTAERLLRVMALSLEPVAKYPLEEMAISEAAPLAARFRLAKSRKETKWEVAPVKAHA